jgi:hypothetical protein
MTRPLRALNKGPTMLSNQSTRRAFLQDAGAVMAIASTAPLLAAAPDEKTKIAVIGTGGMGTGHVRALSARNDVEIAWLCDVDQNRLASAAEVVKQAKGDTPQTTSDLRQLLPTRRSKPCGSPLPTIGTLPPPCWLWMPENTCTSKSLVRTTFVKAGY